MGHEAQGAKVQMRVHQQKSSLIGKFKVLQTNLSWKGNPAITSTASLVHGH